MLTGRKPSAGGFSLIELITVVAILGIFMAIAMPSFRTFILGLQIRGTSESVLNGIQLARAEAIRRNGNVEFTLATSGSTYTKGWEVKVAGGSALQTRSAGESSSDITLAVTPANSTTITFNGLGRRTTNVNGTAPVKNIIVDFPTTVMSAATSPDLRIDVLSGGLVKMCDPNISSSTDPRYCACDPAITVTTNARYCS